MIFKKTFLALSLCTVSAFAVAAPAAPAVPSSPNPLPNLIQGVPAYLTTVINGVFDFTAYPPLIDNDRLQLGGIPQEWKGATTNAAYYVMDFTGAPCMDRFGSCTATPGKGAVEMNTVIVHFEQPLGSKTEATDTTTIGDGFTYTFGISAYRGDEPGVTMSNIFLNNAYAERIKWDYLGTFSGNNLAKRTITFPKGKYSKLVLSVYREGPHTQIGSANVVHIEAHNNPALSIQP
jgi:hypothetical protein